MTATLADYNTVLDSSRYFAGGNGAMTNRGHIPGYKGHTPQLRYNFGKTYGQQTYELETARQRKIPYIAPWQIKSGTPFYNPMSSSYRQVDVANNYNRNVNTDIRPTQYTGDSSRYDHNMIPGYTGYIPRWAFKFGNTYKRECDGCLDEFDDMQYRKGAEMTSSMSEPPMTSRRWQQLQQQQRWNNYDGSQLVDHLNNFQQTNADSKNKSDNSPPIPGYQGFIPRVHVSDVGLGQRFHEMAKSGYTALYKDSYGQNNQQ